MLNTGVLKEILPEVHACVGVTQQQKYHKYDVYQHCVIACDNIDATVVLRLGALLHDVGKPQARNVVDKKKVTFYCHEVMGADIAKGMLNRLKYDEKTVTEVTKLVRLHMYHYTPSFSNAAVRRLIIRAGINKANLKNLDEFPLFKLRRADRIGNGRKKFEVTIQQKELEDKIITLYKESTALSVKELAIKGSDVIHIFSDVKPGPIIGKVLHYCLEKVLEHPELNTRVALLKLAIECLYMEGKLKFKE